MQLPKHPPELVQRFLHSVAVHPDKIAFIFIRDSGKADQLTYQSLYLKSSSLARRLSQQSGNSGGALLIYSAGFDFIIALFACMLANIPAIPIAMPKPRTKDLFRHFLNHTKPDFILTTTSIEGRIKKLLPEAVSTYCLMTTDSAESDTKGFVPAHTSIEIALIQYTSGTTTQPKGVKISFENLYHNLSAIQQHFELDDKSICFSWLPHYHDMGLVDGIMTPFFNGCLGILCSPHYVISNPTQWLKVINRYRVTHTGGPNFFFELCTERIQSASLKGTDLSSLTHVYVSAEPVRKKTLEKFAAYFSTCGFDLNLFTPGYGLAEATLMVSCKAMDTSLHYFVNDGQEYVGLGKAIPGMEIKIIDPVLHQEVKLGDTGEICLRGLSLTPGYTDGEKSEQTMISLPASYETQSYFRTGDKGFLVADELYVVGRFNDTIHIHGLKYQPEDLEYIIINSHPTLFTSPCAVFSILKNEEEKIVVLLEVKEMTDSDKSIEVENSIRDCIFQAFGLTVFDIILLPQGSILKTTSGKIKRSETKFNYLQGKFSNEV
ncbi:MAG: AMP-binding protein [Cyclobacteriaceae bacterium]